MATESSPSDNQPRDHINPLDDSTFWSQRLLEWNPDAPASPVVEVLRRLTERDYYLTRDETDAALLLVTPDSPELTERIREQFSERGKSARLKDAVSGFSHQFFDMPVEERQLEFNRLKSLSEDEPALLAWLDKLSPGLDVERPTLQGDGAFDRLVSACVEQFVASPDKASRMRQEFIHASRENPDFWGRAAITLHLNHHQFTMQVAPWTRKLADWKQVERRYQQTIQYLDQTISYDEASTQVLPQQVETEPMLATRLREASHDESWAGTILIMIGVFTSFGLLAEMFKPTADSTPYSRPTSSTHGNVLPLNSKGWLSEKPTLQDLLRMSEAERAAAFARYPHLKTEYQRLMLEISNTISKERKISAGKFGWSESDDN
ncbi:MAG: hypothetical protein U0941_15480 [Planctomycetaceae bacterium]